MKKMLPLLVVLTIVSCSRAQKTEFSKSALDQNLTGLDAGAVSFSKILEQNLGKTVVIEIWASWCGDCVKAMPKLKALQAAHPEANYVFVSMDKAEDKWKAGIQKHELQGAHYWATDGMKGKFGRSIDLDWIPRYIIVGPDGKILLYRAIETDFELIDSTLNQVK